MAAVRLLSRANHFCRTLLRQQGQVQSLSTCTQLHSSASFESTPQAQIKAGLTEFEVSADPEEFKFVERLLPYKTVPSPPSHTNYPTPSGWIPQKEADLTLPYFVRRTKNHMLPIYQELRNGNTRKLVKIRYIEGDIWALDADLREYLQQVTGSKIIATQVHEIARWIRVKGLYAEHICSFMLKKGF